MSCDAVLFGTYCTPRRTLSQLKKYNFSIERKNHWLGDAIASEEQHFSPLAAILENRCVMPFQ
jgi:hypothetical protein